MYNLYIHRYRPEIPEPALSLSRQWDSNWGYSGFSRGQNNREASYAYVLRSERKNNHAWNAARSVKIVNAFVLRLLPRVWSAKTEIPSIGAPWLSLSYICAGSALLIFWWACGSLSLIFFLQKYLTLDIVQHFVMFYRNKNTNTPWLPVVSSTGCFTTSVCSHISQSFINYWLLHLFSDKPFSRHSMDWK